MLEAFPKINSTNVRSLCYVNIIDQLQVKITLKKLLCRGAAEYKEHSL